ncbi:MAG: hypothetical protein IPL47_16105 [Phyllobacteriaceae bacterium]|nr:hypothetical protein [Phyllobacteriaceae bacterium]
MSEWAGAAWVFAAKGVGAVAGSAISLAYLLPRGRREAALRFTVGLVSGLVFGGAAGLKIGEALGIADAIGEAEAALTGAAAVSLTAWWLVGAAQRVIERFPANRKDEPHA